MRPWDDEVRRCLAAANLDPAREAEVREELVQHLEQRYASLLRLSVDPVVALRDA